MRGTGTDLYLNNPHITKLPDDTEVILMGNPLISDSDKRPVHFLESYCETLSKNLGIQVRCTVNRPYLYLSEDEKGWTNQLEQHYNYKGKFWLVCSGVKNDYTVKGYGSHNYQAVIDKLRGKVQFVQIGESGHNHKPLSGVIDLRGKTDLRQLVRLAYHAQGGLGGESFLHHLFAALQKPFVCIASGFLPPSWVTYPSTTILHRHGKLPCCAQKPCWKSRTMPLGDGDGKDNSLCEKPVLGGAEPVPKCLAMISSDEVAAAVTAYYDGGVLSY